MLLIPAIPGCDIYEGLNSLNCFFSDDDEYDDWDVIPPDNGVIEISVTLNDSITDVPVYIYEGVIEDSLLISFEHTAEQKMLFYLGNGEYSVLAVYQIVQAGEPVTIYSIDGGTLIPDHNDCGDEDYYREGLLQLDVRLP